MITNKNKQIWFCLFFFVINLFSCKKETQNPANKDLVPCSNESTGFHTKGRYLYDRCGERVILRGVNKMTVIKDIDGVPSFKEIAKTGANVVRIMWGTWRPAAEFDEALTNAKKNGLIPIIELHDATGKWGKLGDVIDFWTNPKTVAVLKKHEKYLLINIANEAGDRNVTNRQYKKGYQHAIQRMRSVGIHTPLIIDAAGWGRNEKQLLQVAPWLQQQDPDHNLLFSWHLWDTGNQEKRIASSLERSVDMNLPFIVGEFGNTDVGCKGKISYRYLMKECERLDIGWLAWSWGPGNGNCASMDMTKDGTFKTLHGWGLQVAMTDSNSINNTSMRPESMANKSYNK